MKHPFARLVLHYSTAAAFATSLSWLLMDLSAPAACLDAGGRFDHARRLCSFDSSEQLASIAVPLTELTSFRAFTVFSVIFIVIQVTLQSYPGIARSHRTTILGRSFFTSTGSTSIRHVTEHGNSGHHRVVSDRTTGAK